MNKYVKKATVLMLSAIITVSPLTAYAKTTVQFNKINQSVEVEPVVQGEKTLIGIREFSNIFGAYVEWFSNTHEILIEKGSKKILLKVGSDTADINGEKVKLDFAPTAINGVTMINIEFIASTFGVSVDMDREKGIINITDGSEEQTLNVIARDGIDITYEEVLKRTIDNSDTLKKIMESIDTTEKKLKENQSSSPIGILNQNLAFDSLKYTESETRNKLNYQVISTLNGIMTSESSVELQNLNLEEEVKDLEILKQKYTLGLVSKISLDSALMKYEKDKITFLNSKESLESLYRSFNILINKEVNTKYNIVYTPQYVPVEITSLENYITGKIIDSYTYKTSENALKADQNSIKYYGTDASTIGQYDTMKKALDQSEREHNNLMINLTEKMNTTYTTIKQQEKAYEFALSDLEQVKKDYELAKVKYNMGTISLVELNKAKLELADNENKLKSILTNLVELTLKFQDPDLL